MSEIYIVQFVNDNVKFRDYFPFKFLKYDRDSRLRENFDLVYAYEIIL